MAHRKFSTRRENVKRLSAQEIHLLTQETLQAHFELEREGCVYGAEDIWDVLLAAAVERTTVETICDELEGPSANTVRTALRGLLPNDERTTELEGQLNEMLVSHLPEKLLTKKLPCAADLVYIPYHGQHEEDDDPGIEEIDQESVELVGIDGLQEAKQQRGPTDETLEVPPSCVVICGNPTQPSLLGWSEILAD